MNSDATAPDRDGWVRLPLEECMAAIIDYRGKSPTKTDRGVPLITAKIVKGGRIAPPEEFIDPAEYDAWMRRGLPASGDVLVTTEAPLGEVAQLDGRKVALAQRLIALRANPESLHHRYLCFLMQSPAIQEQLRSRATGTTVLGIKQSELRKVLLEFPPLTQQRAIARILGALDDKIELNRRTSETLEAMIRALFQSSFLDFVGSTELVRAEYERMPRGWSASTLRDHVTLQRGTTYSGNLVGLPGPALLGLGSIEPGGGFRDGHYKTYGGECPEKLTLHPGDLFVALKGATKDGTMVGSIARVPPSVASGRLTQDTVKLQFLKPGSCIDRYIYWLLRTPQYRAYCAGRITGSAQVGLSRDDFLNYPVPVPPDDTLATFAENESSLSQRQDLLAAECKTLAALRDTLLPKLLSGELRVPEAERAAKL